MKNHVWTTNSTINMRAVLVTLFSSFLMHDLFQKVSFSTLGRYIVQEHVLVVLFGREVVARKNLLKIIQYVRCKNT